MNWLALIMAAQEVIHLGVSIFGRFDASHEDQVKAEHVQNLSDEAIEALKVLAPLLKGMNP